MTAVTRAVDRVREADPFLLVARLSLFVAIVNTQENPALLLVVAVATAVMFLNERLLRSPWPWFALAAALGIPQAMRWWLIDDHRVSTTYWLFALGVSRFARNPTVSLRLTARLLVGLVFTLAFAWKLLSSQYTSGDFFRYTLLRDDRFEPAAVVLGDADADDLAVDRLEAYDHLRKGDFDDVAVIDEGPRLAEVATAFAWWGIFIEGAIGLAFLAPLRGRWRRVRPATLLGFCLTTYLLVPVVGFGVLLVTMGLAQETDRRLWPAYVGTVVFVFAWGATLIGLFR